MLQHVTKNTLPSLAFGFFPEKCGAVNDEHGECFLQDISSVEKRYQGKWNWAMLTDYCGTLASDVPTMEYKRRQNEKHMILCVKIYPTNALHPFKTTSYERTKKFKCPVRSFRGLEL